MVVTREWETISLIHLASPPIDLRAAAGGPPAAGGKRTREHTILRGGQKVQSCLRNFGACIYDPSHEQSQAFWNRTNIRTQFHCQCLRAAAGGPPVDGLEHNRSTAAQNLYERYTMCDPLGSTCGAFRRECKQKTQKTTMLDKIQYESQTLPVLPVIFCTTLEF